MLKRLRETVALARLAWAVTNQFAVGERVFHLKFGYGEITGIEGNKLSIDFEKAGPRNVLESFVKNG